MLSLDVKISETARITRLLCSRAAPLLRVATETSSKADLQITIDLEGVEYLGTQGHVSYQQMSRYSCCCPEAGEYAGVAIPPNDMEVQRAFSKLPYIDGASMNFECELTNGLMGDSSFGMTIQDGIANVSSTDLIPAPDVRVRLDYGAFLRLRMGEISIGEALTTGYIIGDIQGGMLLLGLVDSDEWRSAWSIWGMKDRKILQFLDAVRGYENWDELRNVLRGE